MSKSDRWQTRLDPDDSERVESYRDDHDLSNSEAVRRLIRAGLDTEAREEPMPDGGEVADRLDRIEEQQERSDRLDAFQTGANLIGGAFLVAYFAGFVTGLLALGLAAAAAVIEVAALAANYGVFDDE